MNRESQLIPAAITVSGNEASTASTLAQIFAIEEDAGLVPKREWR